jgi:hypothetical protein
MSDMQLITLPDHYRAICTGMWVPCEGVICLTRCHLSSTGTKVANAIRCVESVHTI